jgi:hypothetical protein
MTTSPVAIPFSNLRRRHRLEGSQSFSIRSGNWGRDTYEDDRFSETTATSQISSYLASRSPTNSESVSPQVARSPDSITVDNYDFEPSSLPPSYLSRSSSTRTSFSSPYFPPRLARAFSLPREQVTGNDPLCTFEDLDSPCSDSEAEAEHDDESVVSPPLNASKEHLKRKTNFKSSLTTSLKALKGKIPSPTIYAPQLDPRARSHSNNHRPDRSHQDVHTSLSTSLPVFDPSDLQMPPSSAIHLQTYSVSLGPPRKPRETRFNSDFLRLLALEMEMRRSGKFVSILPKPSSNGTSEVSNQGIVVSGKVRMTLPRRTERERDDVNISVFNRSRLKW